MLKKEKRTMKVYEASDKNYKPVAQIRLQGRWLEELGFIPGTSLEVKCEEEKLIITKKD